VGLYSFTLTARTRVALQVSNVHSFALNTCLEVFTTLEQPSIEGGVACSGLLMRLDLMLEAGTYFVLVSDEGHNHTGPYTFLL
jgi:hypothetical protein